MRKCLLLALAGCLLFAGMASAADITVKNTDSTDWPTIRVVVEANDAEAALNDYTLKTDSMDRPLHPSSVRVLEKTESAPSNTVVLLDTSRSLSPAHLEAAKAALGKYAGLVDRNEQLGLVSFNDNVELVTGLTSDRAQFRDRLSNLRLEGQNTTLYRAMMYGIDMLKDVPGDRVLLVVTDGKDEGSSVTREQVMKAAADNNIRISAIGIPGLPGKQSDTYLPRLAGFPKDAMGEYRTADSAADLEQAAYDLMVADNGTVATRLYELTYILPESLRRDDAMRVNADLVRTWNGITDTGTVSLLVPALVRQDAAPVVAPAADTRVEPAPGSSIVDTEPMQERSFLAKYWPWLLALLLLLLFWMLFRKRRPETVQTAYDSSAVQKTYDTTAVRTKDESSMLVINFPELDLSFPLRPGTMVMGSGPDADILVGDPSIDDAHVEFCSGDECLLRPVIGSRGVLLNGKTVGEPTPLKPGDELLVGDVKAVIKKS